MSYSIKPLILNKVRVSKGLMTYLVDYEKQIWLPHVVWYIKGGEKNILVDTGIPFSIYESKYSYGRPCEEVQTFEQALSSVNLSPEDVDLVIQTHLHFDHCGNTYKCNKAKVIVQEEELKFAYSPHAVFVRSYNLEFLKGLRFEVVSGEVEILPGIKVIHLPGHTPGTQAVSIETRKGRAVISGFCCIGENLFPPEKLRAKWPVIAPGVSVNPLQAFDSALKLKGLGEILIPQHDMELAQRPEIP